MLFILSLRISGGSRTTPCLPTIGASHMEMGATVTVVVVINAPELTTVTGGVEVVTAI